MLRYTSCHKARTARRLPYGTPFTWRAPRGTIKCTNSKRLFKNILLYSLYWGFLVKVVIILKAMAALNLSTKNSNRGRENYLAMIRSRFVNKFLFSVSYETPSKPNMIKYYRFLSFFDKTASADFSSVSYRPN